MKQFLNLITQKTSLNLHEAWWLLEHVTGKTKEQLILANDLTDAEIEKLDQVLVELVQHQKPLAYIMGFVPFLNLNLQVASPILIPRHETEQWVAQLIEQLAPHASQIRSILDIGTGSGCIALALAQHFPNAQVVAIDINPQALQLAQSNAQKNGINNVEFLSSNLFENLQTRQFDLIVSNPPYINPEMRPTMSAQVTEWEDHGALFAQQKGLAIIQEILQNSAQFLNKNPQLPVQLVLEIDQDQKDVVLAKAEQSGWTAQAYQDSFGKWRTIWCKKT